MTPAIRRIRAEEGPSLRALRLRALADAPMAFGSTLAREEAFTEDEFRARARIARRGEGGYGIELIDPDAALVAALAKL